MMTVPKQFVAFAAVAAVLFGRITDITTGQPLPNVRVVAGSHAATTDAHGAYRIVGLPPGHYTLTVRSSDVPPQHFNVDVKGSNASMQFDLRACSTTLDYMCGGPAPGGPPGSG
jgi:protocatechuate 3,4-dioxygenase beta subunit